MRSFRPVYLSKELLHLDELVHRDDDPVRDKMRRDLRLKRAFGTDVASNWTGIPEDGRVAFPILYRRQESDTGVNQGNRATLFTHRIARCTFPFLDFFPKSKYADHIPRFKRF